MAYYHGRVKLNRYEQFEIAGDTKPKKSQAPKPVVEYGAGIAAQFGLVKKAVPPNVRRNVGVTPLKKKKRLPSQDEEDEDEDEDDDDSDSTGGGEAVVKKAAPTNIRRNSEGVPLKKKKRALSEEEDSDSTCRTAKNERRNEAEKASLLHKSTKKSLPKEVNLGFIGHEEFDDESSDKRNKNAAKKKAKHQDSVHLANIRRSVSSPNEGSADSDDGGGSDAESMRIAKEELLRNKIRKQNAERKKKKRENYSVDDDATHRNHKNKNALTASSSKVHHSKNFNRSVSSPNEEESENSDDDSNPNPIVTQYKKRIPDDDMVRSKIRKENEIANLREKKRKERSVADENSDDDVGDVRYKRRESHDGLVKKKKKKRRETVDTELLRNANNKERNIPSKEADMLKSKKQKTFTIPKLNKEVPVSGGRPGQNNTLSNEQLRRENQVTSQKPRQSVPLNNSNTTSKDQLLTNQSKECTSSIQPNAIKTEPGEGGTFTSSSIEAATVKTEPNDEIIEISNNISQESTNIRNKSRLKSSSNLSHVLSNVDSTSKLSNSPVKSTTEKCKSSLMKDIAKRSFSSAFDKDVTRSESGEVTNSLAARITSSNAFDATSRNYSGNSKKSAIELQDSPSDEKSASSLIEQYATEAWKGKDRLIKINIGNEECVVQSTKNICCRKGEDLLPWFAMVNNKLQTKTTKADNPSLNYFITLHSRFKVMETMEMSDLEVLPEEEGKEGFDPIRIFTSLCKDHYQQYLEGSYLNSIPELIITRLYSTT